MVGVSRENVNRALAVIATGAIRREAGRYLLVDEDQLRQRVVEGVGPMAERRDRRRDVDRARHGTALD
jgi:hypothetical protein